MTESRVRTVLCFGDSLTWGCKPDGSGRHDKDAQWPTVLAKALGPDAVIITEGLVGRTTVYDDNTVAENRNGAQILPTLLATHSPLDLVVIMLGLNDLKSYTGGSAFAARQGMKRLIQLVRQHPYGFGFDIPDILIVAPPHIRETAHEVYSTMFMGKIAQSKQLSVYYSDLADQYDCQFFDASSIAKASVEDGIHLDEDNTKNLGRAFVSPIRMILGL